MALDDIKKTVLDYLKTAENMVKGKSVEDSAEDNERADALEHDDEVEKAEKEVRRLEQQLKEVKTELARKKEEKDRFKKELPEIKPSQPPKKREAKRFYLEEWQKACLWYGSIITLVVAVLWFGILFVTLKEWWQMWYEPYIIASIKITLRILEYSLVYILVRLTFCWLFYDNAYKDTSVEVYMNLSTVGKWHFVMAFWNNAVFSTFKFYRGIFANWPIYRHFIKPARHLIIPGLCCLGDLLKKNGKILFGKRR